MYYIAVFGSRMQSIKFSGVLARHRVPSSVISTPREASLGCGVCVKFEPSDFERVKDIYQKESAFSRVMFYKVRKNGKGFLVNRI